MSHEHTETVKTSLGWVNRRTVHKNKKMTPEQRRFFSKIFKTRKEAEQATKTRSNRYKVRERQRIKK